MLLDQIKNSHEKYIDGKTFIEKVKEIFIGFDIGNVMAQNRIYESGFGEKKKTIETELKPKYR